MISSMTAFARQAAQGNWGSAAWEIRSVNHRYLEVSVKLPESLRALEPMIRDKLRQKIQRGKVECFLKFAPAIAAATLSINYSLVKELAAATTQIAPQFPVAQTDIVKLLNWPGVLNMPEQNLAMIEAELLKLFDKTLVDLSAHRQREGEQIIKVINERLEKITKIAELVKQRQPILIEQQQQQLKQRFLDANISLNSERLEQEMVMFAQKMDVAEELDRLNIHIKETRKALQQGGAVGRRLDFLMQELNREANTTASKSVDAEVSTYAVELRVLIEQMREQVQNIE